MQHAAKKNVNLPKMNKLETTITWCDEYPLLDLTSYYNINMSGTKELMKVTRKQFKYTVPELEYLIYPVIYMSVVSEHHSQHAEHLLV